MQMVKKIVIALFVLWLALLVLMPKQELYYKLEKQLEEGMGQGAMAAKIEINEKSISEGWFSLTLKGLDVYVQGIKLATIEEVSVFTLLFYTNIEIHQLVLDETLKAVVPTQTKEVNFRHVVWIPAEVGINAQGSFGGLMGSASLVDKTVRLDFNDSKAIESLQKKLKKDEKGWYYEASF